MGDTPLGNAMSGNSRLSHVDSNDYMRGLQRALDVKGVRNAPDKLLVDSIKVIADAVQAGFAIRETDSFNVSGEALNSPDTIADFNMFSPLNSDFARGTQRNNFDHDIRVLFWHFQVIGFTSNTDNWTGRHIFKHVRDGATTQCPAIIQETEQNRGPDWCLPGQVRDLASNYQNVPTTSWNGWLPSNIIWNFEISKNNGSNFGTAKSVNYECIYVRVPKGAQLPL